MLSLVGLFNLFGFLPNINAQEKQDPTAPSTVIEQTLSKIRDVEKLDTFVQQNAVLVQENKKLKAEIASIQKQIAKLSKDLELQTNEMNLPFPEARERLMNRIKQDNAEIKQ